MFPYLKEPKLFDESKYRHKIILRCCTNKVEKKATIQATWKYIKATLQQKNDVTYTFSDEEKNHFGPQIYKIIDSAIKNIKNTDYDLKIKEIKTMIIKLYRLTYGSNTFTIMRWLDETNGTFTNKKRKKRKLKKVLPKILNFIKEKVDGKLSFNEGASLNQVSAKLYKNFGIDIPSSTLSDF